MSRKTGELQINNGEPDSHCSLFFRSDHLLHAQYKQLEGLFAFESILKLKQGYFKFRMDQLPEKTTIDKPITFLLLNYHSRCDELEKLNSLLPGDNEILSIKPDVADVPNLNTEEWQVLSMVDGRRNIRRICEKLGDELICKRRLIDLISKGLVGNDSNIGQWEKIIPVLIPASASTCDRPYPPRIRTNLILKSIDSRTSLAKLWEKSKLKKEDFLEDIKFLHEFKWIDMNDQGKKIFNDT